jgi:putative FmdB family regulatory protein
MPTYEYVCEKCGHTFDKFQSISDAPLKTCPQDLCGRKRWGKGAVRRAISGGAGLIFKGSGFYITDYRSEGYKEAAKKDSKESAPTPPASADSKSSSGNGKPAPAPVKPAGKSKPS